MNQQPFISVWTDRAGGDAEGYVVPVIDQLTDAVEVECPDSFATPDEPQPS